MKLFSLSIIIITISLISCDDFINPLGPTSESSVNTNFTRMVIVQTIDSVRCIDARLHIDNDRYYLFDFECADNEGKIPISHIHHEYFDSVSLKYIVYRDTTDMYKWEGDITLYKGIEYKEFYITFPNF